MGHIRLYRIVSVSFRIVCDTTATILALEATRRVIGRHHVGDHSRTLAQATKSTLAPNEWEIQLHSHALEQHPYVFSHTQTKNTHSLPSAHIRRSRRANPRCHTWLADDKAHCHIAISTQGHHRPTNVENNRELATSQTMGDSCWTSHELHRVCKFGHYRNPHFMNLFD